MKTRLKTKNFSAFIRLIRSTGTVALTPALLLLSTIYPSYGASATWSASPPSGNWNIAGNWTPATIPNGPADTATFAVSGRTVLGPSASTEVNGIIFNAGASPFTITSSSVSLTISGLGITNNSGITQNFVVSPKPFGDGFIYFLNSATAGISSSFLVKGTNSASYVGTIQFYGTSSAGSANVILEGSSVAGYYGGQTSFYDSANPDNASFTLNGGAVSGGYGGDLEWYSAISNPVTGNVTLGGGAVAGANGAQMYIFSSLASSISSNFTVGGGAATSAGGAYLDFHPSTVTDVDGNFTAEGGSASGATGGSIAFDPFGDHNFNGTFTVNGGTAGGAAGGTAFIGAYLQTLTGTSNFTVNGGAVAGALGGIMACNAVDTGNRTCTANGGNGNGATGGSLDFSSCYGVSGTLVANGGTNGGSGGSIHINTTNSGSIPRVEAFGNGSVDVSGWSAGASAAGSIEGSGIIKLGSYNLTVGSNNLSTVFSGVLKDAGLYSNGPGSLTKIGVGTLTLSGANTYTGGTTVTGGTLLVSNLLGSGTGTGAVTATTSTLGGTGIISGGDVTVGSNSGPGAFLSPGDPGIGTLTIKRTLRFKRRATYNCELDSNTATADKAKAKGIAINNPAQIVLSDIGASVLPLGTVFTIIDNTAATAINGAFGNLANGSTVTLGSNNYQVSYTGGTGNDLTLTVVP